MCDEALLLRVPRRRGAAQLLGCVLEPRGECRRLAARGRDRVVREGLRVIADPLDVLDDCAACDERIGKLGAWALTGVEVERVGPRDVQN